MIFNYINFNPSDLKARRYTKITSIRYITRNPQMNRVIYKFTRKGHHMCWYLITYPWHKFEFASIANKNYGNICVELTNSARLKSNGWNELWRIRCCHNYGNLTQTHIYSLHYQPMNDLSILISMAGKWSACAICRSNARAIWEKQG